MSEKLCDQEDRLSLTAEQLEWIRDVVQLLNDERSLAKFDDTRVLVQCMTGGGMFAVIGEVRYFDTAREGFRFVPHEEKLEFT